MEMKVRVTNRSCHSGESLEKTKGISIKEIQVKIYTRSGGETRNTFLKESSLYFTPDVKGPTDHRKGWRGVSEAKRVSFHLRLRS